MDLTGHWIAGSLLNLPQHFIVRDVSGAFRLRSRNVSGISEKRMPEFSGFRMGRSRPDRRCCICPPPQWTNRQYWLKSSVAL
jgi:hypothetical protein